MARYTGKDLHVEFGGTDLSGDFRTLEVTESIDIVDASAGSDTHKEKLTGQEDWTATLTILDTTDGSTIWEAVDKGTEGTLTWYPQGTASGKPKHYGKCIVSERSRNFPYNDVVEITVTFEGNGVVTDTTVS